MTHFRAYKDGLINGVGFALIVGMSIMYDKLSVPTFAAVGVATAINGLSTYVTYRKYKQAGMSEEEYSVD